MAPLSCTSTKFLLFFCKFLILLINVFMLVLVSLGIDKQ